MMMAPGLHCKAQVGPFEYSSTSVTSHRRLPQISSFPISLALGWNYKSRKRGVGIHTCSLASSPNVEVHELKRLKRAHRWGNLVSPMGEVRSSHLNLNFVLSKEME